MNGELQVRKAFDAKDNVFSCASNRRSETLENGQICAFDAHNVYETASTMIRSESSCWADAVEEEEAETGSALPQPVDRTISDTRHQPTEYSNAEKLDRNESAGGSRGDVDFRGRGVGFGGRGGRGGSFGDAGSGARFDSFGGSERRHGRGARGEDRGEDRGGLPPRRPGWQPPAIPSEESRAARPRLKLKPRSEQAGSGDQTSGGSSSIFGQAKPIDTTAKMAALDVRDSNMKRADKRSEKRSEKGRESAKTDDAGGDDDKAAKPRAPKAPPVLKTEHNPTKLDNPFDLLGEE